MRAFAALFKNELKLNIRDMNMVIFAVIMPIIGDCEKKSVNLINC